MSIINILIADPDLKAVAELSGYISSSYDMNIAGCAYDGETALDIIIAKKPDIALLSASLPKIDGLGILEEMKKLSLKETKVILFSEISNSRMIKEAADSGADYYLIKPLDPEILLRRIRQVYGLKTAEPSSYSFDRTAAALRSFPERTNEVKVSQVLNKVGIYPRNIGYHYFKKAIIMTINDESALIGITKCMYPEIAKEYKATGSRVERAMRHSLAYAWKNGGEKSYCDMFGLERASKPTNSQFIASVAEHIRIFQ